MQASPRIDGGGRVRTAGVEERRELQTKWLRHGHRELFLTAIEHVPRIAFSHVLAGVERDGGRAIVGHEAAALADDDALAMCPGYEIVRLDRHRHVAEA